MESASFSEYERVSAQARAWGDDPSRGAAIAGGRAMEESDREKSVALDPADAGDQSLRRLRVAIERVGPVDSPVLVWGDSRAERERVARALHARSPRRERPFVMVRCAPLPLELLESEIFGYGPAAFTGAHRQKPGRLEMAEGGTIFLDDIGAMPPVLQGKLLQVLLEGEFSQPGNRHGIRVDARVVGGTGPDLEQRVVGGQFRADLFRRLNASSIHTSRSEERTSELQSLRHLVCRLLL